MANRIELNQGASLYDEGVAAAAINPGALIKLDTTAGEVAVHNSVADFSNKAFALEDALQGKTVDDAYATGDVVGFFFAKTGALVNALIKADEVIVRGDKLVSGGDGTLVKFDSAVVGATPVNEVVAFAEEDIDLTGGVDTRSPVRVA